MPHNPLPVANEADQSALPISARRVSFMLLLLTWAAGSVDATSYLELGDVFTANMTGNTVLLGIALGQGHGWAALKSILALAGFASGVASGTIIVEQYPQRGSWSPWITRGIIAETVFLGLFALAWLLTGHTPGAAVKDVLILLSAVAMGLQSATVRYLNVPGVVTTFITGTLTSIMAEIISGLGPLGHISPALHGTPDAGRRHTLPSRWRERLRLQTAVLLVYCLAAMASILIANRWPAYETLLPLAALCMVLILAPHR